MGGSVAWCERRDDGQPAEAAHFRGYGTRPRIQSSGKVSPMAIPCQAAAGGKRGAKEGILLIGQFGAWPDNVGQRFFAGGPSGSTECHPARRIVARQRGDRRPHLRWRLGRGVEGVTGA